MLRVMLMCEMLMGEVQSEGEGVKREDEGEGD